MTPKNITIIGAGLGGLALANMLHSNGIDAVVYESEQSSTFRKEGGILVMHEDVGEHALKLMKLFDKYQDIVVRASGTIRVYDKSAILQYEDSECVTISLVEREKLRNMLLASLPKSMVQWDKKIVRAISLENGQHQIITASGESFLTDLLIGADGIWSKVRPLVSNKKPKYCGTTFIETRFENVNEKYKKISKIVGSGSLIALSDKKGIITESNTGNTLNKIIVYFTLKLDEKSIKSISHTINDTKITKSKIYAYFKDWDEKLQTFITENNNEFILRPIYLLPQGHSWKRIPGVTLLGDAAHAMSPVGSIGANQAMLDGVELAQAIITHPDNTEEALSAYEKDMFPRSKAVTADTVSVLTNTLKPDGLHRYIELLKS
jgi:2-polyprenyl-6-methoxyphenol hydroxylase-like FAD-dependent oxidoreductase